MKTKFFGERKDTTEKNISDTAKFLDKKPLRQGSNQRQENVNPEGQIPEKK
jgi:hypothetical protein